MFNEHERSARNHKVNDRCALRDWAPIFARERNLWLRRVMNGECIDETLRVCFVEFLQVSTTTTLRKARTTEPRSALARAQITGFLALRALNIGEKRGGGGEADAALFIDVQQELHIGVGHGSDELTEATRAKHHALAVKRTNDVNLFGRDGLPLIIESNCSIAMVHLVVLAWARV